MENPETLSRKTKKIKPGEKRRVKQQVQQGENEADDESQRGIAAPAPFLMPHHACVGAG